MRIHLDSLAVARSQRRCHQQQRQQSCMLNGAPEPQVFMACVRAVAHRAHAIQGCGVQAGEVSVRAPAGETFLQLQAQLISQLAGHAPQLPVGRCSFHRGAAKAALDLQGSALDGGFQAEDGGFDPLGVGLCRHPDIDHGLALGRNHVGSEPAVNGADVDRDTPVEIIQRKQGLDHVGKFQDGAGAGARVQSRHARLRPGRSR